MYEAFDKFIRSESTWTNMHPCDDERFLEILRLVPNFGGPTFRRYVRSKCGGESGDPLEDIIEHYIALAEGRIP
jgi:hypothetical protein